MILNNYNLTYPTALSTVVECRIDKGFWLKLLASQIFEFKKTE
jgi:hypothetical protein